VNAVIGPHNQDKVTKTSDRSNCGVVVTRKGRRLVVLAIMHGSLLAEFGKRSFGGAYYKRATPNGVRAIIPTERTVNEGFRSLFFSMFERRLCL
jgi:hypothetical protein